MSQAKLPPTGPGPWRVVFMGTPDFALPSLARLADTQRVVGVFTQPDRPAGRGRRLLPSPVKAFAQARGIPVLQPGSFKGEPEAFDALRALEPQLLVVAAYGLILPQRVLDVAPGGALNVHASILPRWRGASPIAHAILAGDAEVGVTIMRMEAGLDTGPMLARRAIAMPDGISTGELSPILAELGAELLVKTLPGWMAGQLEAEIQEESLASYAPRLSKDDGRLDWREPAEAIARRVRAMAPWPGAFTEWQGQRIKVHAATVIATPVASEADNAPPGLVIAGEAGLCVATGAGWLRLDRIQAPGGKPMPARDFVRGRQDFLGARLGAPGEAEAAP